MEYEASVYPAAIIHNRAVSITPFARLAPHRSTAHTSLVGPAKIRPSLLDFLQDLGAQSAGVFLCVKGRNQARECTAPFLRQPSSPNTPRPVAKSGSVAGNGTALISLATWVISISPEPNVHTWKLS